MPYAYATTNLISAYTNVTFTTGPADATRAALIDGRMASQFVCTSSSTGLTISVDLGASVAVAGFAMLNHNLYNLGSVVPVAVQAADDAAFTIGVVSPKASTNISRAIPQHKDTVIQFASTTKRYWKIGLTWGVAFQMKLGELIFFSSTQLTRRDVYGPSKDGERMRLATVTTQSLEQRSYLVAGPQRFKRLEYVDLTDSEKGELQTLWRAVQGSTRPFLWIQSYEATSTAAADTEQDCIYGKLDLDEFGSEFVDFGRRGAPALIINSLGREAGA